MFPITKLYGRFPKLKTIHCNLVSTIVPKYRSKLQFSIKPNDENFSCHEKKNDQGIFIIEIIKVDELPIAHEMLHILPIALEIPKFNKSNPSESLETYSHKTKCRHERLFESIYNFTQHFFVNSELQRYSFDPNEIEKKWIELNQNLFDTGNFLIMIKSPRQYNLLDRSLIILDLYFGMNNRATRKTFLRKIQRTQPANQLKIIKEIMNIVKSVGEDNVSNIRNSNAIQSLFDQLMKRKEKVGDN